MSRAFTGVGPRLLDLKAAAAYSGIGYWSLRTLIDRGELAVCRVGSLRKVMIDRAELDRKIAAWTVRESA